MLESWYTAREISRGLMRQKHGRSIEGRVDLNELLAEYERAHDRVTQAGGEFLSHIDTPCVFH